MPCVWDLWRSHAAGVSVNSRIPRARLRTDRRVDRFDSAKAHRVSATVSPGARPTLNHPRSRPLADRTRLVRRPQLCAERMVARAARSRSGNDSWPPTPYRQSARAETGQTQNPRDPASSLAVAHQERTTPDGPMRGGIACRGCNVRFALIAGIMGTTECTTPYLSAQARSVDFFELTYAMSWTCRVRDGVRPSSRRSNEHAGYCRSSCSERSRLCRAGHRPDRRASGPRRGSAAGVGCDAHEVVGITAMPGRLRAARHAVPEPARWRRPTRRSGRNQLRQMRQGRFVSIHRCSRHRRELRVSTFRATPRQFWRALNAVIRSRSSAPFGLPRAGLLLGSGSRHLQLFSVPGIDICVQAFMIVALQVHRRLGANGVALCAHKVAPL
jgi:hypothetical protein